ncbi:MAG: TIR domain-containing protein [Anaerolineae bacterium]|nr:TIR domain-containing protein [Anaerolineae bacterium]
MNISPKIFISYAKEDLEAAKRLFDDLLHAGAEPWLDKENLLPGQRWDVVIEDSIRSSQFFIVVLSTRTVSKKGFIQKELRIALDYLDEFPETEIFIIPIRIENCEVPHHKLERIHYVDMFPSWEQGFKKVLQAIEVNERNTAVYTSAKIDNEQLGEINFDVTNQDKQDISSLLRRLDQLIGLEQVKSEVKHIVTAIESRKKLAKFSIISPQFPYNFLFIGNPGTGKTTVAHILGGIFRELGVLSRGHLVEVTLPELIGEYVGQTASKTKLVIDSSRGGVLLIDGINQYDSSFGGEALSIVLESISRKESDDLVLIISGYPDEMSKFLSKNPGIKSRLRHIYFPDFSEKELLEMLNKKSQ